MSEEKDEYSKKAKELQDLILEEAKKNYSEKAIQHFMNPKNLGKMNNPNGFASVKGKCGDTMEIYIKVQDEKISDILFYTDGCGVTISCASFITTLAKGKTIKDALKISANDIVDEFQLSKVDTHCAILAVLTLYSAISDYILKR